MCRKMSGLFSETALLPLLLLIASPWPSVLTALTPRILATKTIVEGTTDFQLDLNSLLQTELGDQVNSIERISFFKEEQAYPFHIDSSSRIVLRSVLDREQVCRAGRSPSPCPEQCCKLLRIEVRFAGQQAREFYIKVLVDDVNDSAPKFENNMELRYIRLSEDAHIGYELELAVATDADTPENGVAEYSLAEKRPDNATFDRHFQLIDATSTPKLRLTQRLDREETSAFAFILRAVDNGRPPLTGTLPVAIEVKDVNDQEPKISGFQPGYTIRVNETDRKMRVAYFEVEDGDSGENGRVECQIKVSPLVPAMLRADRYFEVKQSRRGLDESRPTKWEITTILSINYEQVKNFSFYIVAKDFGHPVLSTSVSVSIIVQNVDDHPISIVFWSDGSQRQRVELMENGQVGVKIASVEVKDRDFEVKQEYERIQCSLREGAEQFRLQEKQVYDLVKEYDLITATSFDREKNVLHYVSVVCRESLTPVGSSSASATLTVAISDANDSPPEFSRQLYRGSVAENSLRKTIVQMDAHHRISATDPDAPPNNRVLYRLYGSDAFAINSQGEITVEGDIDYERQRVYQLNVTAVNDNKESMSSHAAVIIDVIDLNDHPPVILNYDKGYSFTVKEELSDFTIGTINATDRDTLPLNKEIIFRILPNSGGSGGSSPDAKFREAEPGRYFRLDSKTGELRVTAKIDWERQQLFQFRVQAENQIKVTLAPGSTFYPGDALNSQSITTVTVNVINVNDHPPQLCRMSHPSTRSYLSCQEPPDPLRVTFADSGIFVNQAVGPQDHKCTVFEYEVRDADEPDGVAIGAPRVSLGHVTEIYMDRRLPVKPGSIEFHLDSHMICLRRLPAKQVEKEVYELAIQVRDPHEPRHRKDYLCLVTILRVKPPPQPIHNNGRQNVNHPPEGPVGEKRHFVIIVTLVTAVVFIIVIVFAFVLFFYVRRFDRSLEKDYDNEEVTMPLQGASAKQAVGTATLASGGGELHVPIGAEPVMPSETPQQPDNKHAGLLYSNTHHRDHCSSSDGEASMIGGGGGGGNDLGLESARRRYEIWCDSGSGGAVRGTGTMPVVQQQHQQHQQQFLLHRPSLTLQRNQHYAQPLRHQLPPATGSTTNLPVGGVRRLAPDQRASSCDDLDLLTAVASPAEPSNGSNGYQVIDQFANAFRTPQHQQSQQHQLQHQQPQQHQQPMLSTYQRLLHPQGTASSSLRTSTEPLYSPKKSLKNTYFETSFV